jgi:glutamate racemase
MIQKTLGGDVRVFDGGEGTAKEMKRRLGEAGLLTERTTKGNVEFRNSLESKEKLELCRRLFEIK